MSENNSISTSSSLMSNSFNMNNNNLLNSNTTEYLAQLLKDKKQLAAFPNVFIHLERLLDEGKQIN